jgi:2-dehydro-3-deoxyphosphogluconate aldolase/(4S)-4-hydroxy-2-oxoglutarate aldolase
MNKIQVRDRIVEIGIVPVIRGSSAREAHLAAEAVCRGGIPIVEVTLTVPGAIDVIRELVRTSGGELLVGAGTVRNPDIASKCLDAGAQFLVTPGINLRTIDLAVQAKVLMISGALTPTEIMMAWDAGSDFVKVFPCGEVGGARYLKALKAPMPDIPLVPTGGVTLKTAAEYILAGAAALGIGGELILKEALRSNKLDIISENARYLVALVRRTREGMSRPEAVQAGPD